MWERRRPWSRPAWWPAVSAVGVVGGDAVGPVGVRAGRRPQGGGGVRGPDRFRARYGGDYAAGRRSWVRGDRGSASVWLLGLCSVLVLAAVAAVLLGSALVTRHRAIAAADLSALAAAATALEGAGPACAAAAGIATSMGAELTACALSGVVADVTVTVTAELGVVGLASARASARAGPVDYVAAPGAASYFAPARPTRPSVSRCSCYRGLRLTIMAFPSPEPGQIGHLLSETP